jgi:hypothetical protein
MVVRLTTNNIHALKLEVARRRRFLRSPSGVTVLGCEGNSDTHNSLKVDSTLQ